MDNLFLRIVKFYTDFKYIIHWKVLGNDKFYIINSFVDILSIGYRKEIVV